MTTEFDDIRPYNDAEVPAALERMVNSPELLLAIAKLKAPRMASLCPWFVKPMVKMVLKRQLKGIETVDQFQTLIFGYMSSMVATRVTEFTYSGMESLDKNKAYLFISNHRDIAMDPGFLNYGLYDKGYKSVRIAIGDNLLTKPYVSDLMRINKSFIVNRSSVGAREKYKAAKHLSSYIHYSIVEENNGIWIAQREGRAKNGLDSTNSAVLSMIALSKPKTVELSDYIRELNIVPVAISYEWDPCDQMKARELYAHEEHGSYEKGTHEDIASIAAGIDGHKGHVHIAFGEVLQGQYTNTEEVAQAIDGQIWDKYVLHPSNHLAYQQLYHKTEDYPVTAKQLDFDEQQYASEKVQLQSRLTDLPQTQKDILLGIYANAIVSKSRTSS